MKMRGFRVAEELWRLVDAARGESRFGIRPSWIGTLRALVLAGLAARASPAVRVISVLPVNEADERTPPPKPARKLRQAEPGRSYAECLAVLDAACADPTRFVIGDASALTKGQVMQLHRLAKKYEPEAWARVGRYIAAVASVHDHGRRQLTARWVSRALEEAVQDALLWEQRATGLSAVARERLARGAARSGGRLVAWEDRTLSADEVAGVEALAKDFGDEDWDRLGEWMARGGVAWIKEPVVPARLLERKGREWFQRALAAHRPQIATPGARPADGATLLDLMQNRDGGEVRRVVDHRR